MRERGRANRRLVGRFGNLIERSALSAERATPDPPARRATAGAPAARAEDSSGWCDRFLRPGHLAGQAALSDASSADARVDLAVLGYAITSMEIESYRPARLILLGADASTELGRATSLDALVT